MRTLRSGTYSFAEAFEIKTMRSKSVNIDEEYKNHVHIVIRNQNKIIQ